MKFLFVMCCGYQSFELLVTDAKDFFDAAAKAIAAFPDWHYCHWELVYSVKKQCRNVTKVI